MILSLADILQAYALGYFPMADSATAAEFHWYDPPRRAIIPLDRFHISRRLKRTLRQGSFDIRVNAAFAEVITLCGDLRPEGTWINREIRDIFIALHEAGHAHSVECWRGSELAGGVYGLALGGTFCAESMFSRARDASKVALCHLAARLWAAGFETLDAQLMNDHLRQFGAIEISVVLYREKLRNSLKKNIELSCFSGSAPPSSEIINTYIDFLSN